MTTVLNRKEIYTLHSYDLSPEKEIEISNLAIGDYVKLCFEESHSKELWVAITKINGDNFEGILDNMPVGLKSIRFGDKVKFESKHIIKLQHNYLND